MSPLSEFRVEVRIVARADAKFLVLQHREGNVDASMALYLPASLVQQQTKLAAAAVSVCNR